MLLRKCLVLGHQLKNDRLKARVESRLNGNPDQASLSDCRKVPALAKRLHSGLARLGAGLNSVRRSS